eukprot:scaffold188149_cov33-Tisochrysis_lutea.AAC.1
MVSRRGLTGGGGGGGAGSTSCSASESISAAGMNSRPGTAASSASIAPQGPSERGEERERVKKTERVDVAG